MVNLESIDSLKVDFKVPETFLRRVQVGQSMQLTLDAIPGQAYDGKVLAIKPAGRCGGPVHRDPRRDPQYERGIASGNVRARAPVDR